MAKINVQAIDMLQTGRAQVRDPKLQNIALNYTATFATQMTYTFDMATINQLGRFGIVRSLFVDNGTNPSSIEVRVTGTESYFTIPAFAQGYFTVIAQDNSAIILDSVGGATDTVNIALFNYDVEPNVWYSYGPTNLAAPIKVYGPLTPGSTVSSQATNTPVFIGAMDGGGIFRAVRCDANGNLNMAGTISISSITIADGNDVAEGSTVDSPVTDPANPGSLISLNKGLLFNIGQVTDASVTLGNNGSVISQLKGISVATGSVNQAAETNPANNGSIIQFLKGLITTSGTIADGPVTNPASNASLIAVNKGQLSGIGAVADAAVTNPASNGSIIALLKGAITGLNSLFSRTNSATGTQSIVAGAAADTVILASNANRKGATVYNDSSATLNLLLSNAVSSSTVWTLQLAQGDYYEVPFGYTGAIKGIWASATGNARVTEFS